MKEEDKGGRGEKQGGRGGNEKVEWKGRYRRKGERKKKLYQDRLIKIP